MFAASPTCAYASEEDDQIENLLQMAGQIDQLEDNAVSEDANAKRDRIIELLRNKVDELDEDPTVEGGYKIIASILSDSQVDLDGWGSVASVNWKKAYKEEAMSLGVNFDSLYSQDPETGVEYKNGNSAKDDVEDAAIKVNILTWNNTKDSQGHDLSKANQGVISKLLTTLDTQSIQVFMSTIQGISIALAIAFSMCNISNMVSDRNASDEMITREFIKLLAGVWFIYNYRFFALLIIRVGTLVLENLQLDIGSSPNSAAKYALVKSFCTFLKGQNLTGVSIKAAMTGFNNSLSDVGTSMSGIFGSLTQLSGNGIIQVASSLTIYFVVIDLGLRYIFTPAAIATLFTDNNVWRSNGCVWLKKLFAVSMQGAVIILIIYVTDRFKTQLGASFSVITNTAINLTMIGMFVKSKMIANDMIGVH